MDIWKWKLRTRYMYLLFNLRLTTSVSSQVVQHALIGAYGQAGQWQNAIDIFRMMQQSGEVVLMLSSCELVQNLNRLSDRLSLTGFVDYRNNQQHCHMGSSLMLALERRELMFSLILLNLASWTSPLVSGINWLPDTTVQIGAFNNMHTC